MSHPFREAAQLLWQHRQAGTTLDALPAPLRPLDADQGHAVQAELPTVTGQAVAGWKIAATSTVGQAHIGVPGPLPGRILTSFVRPPGEPVSLRGNRMRVAEPEFAFAMAQDLAPQALPYTQQQVMAAVASLHPALEVPDSRLEPFTAAGQAQLLADNACARHFVLGPAAPTVWRDLDLSTYPVHAQVQHGS